MSTSISRRRRVIVRRHPLTTVGVDAVRMEDDGAFICVHITDDEAGVRGLLLRLGSEASASLASALHEARAVAFDLPLRRDVGSASPPPPGPCDGALVPGEPWRVGRWVAPLRSSAKGGR